MPVFMFQPPMAELIWSEKKRQTIRRVWKRPVKPGQRFVAMIWHRTPWCQRIFEGVVTSVVPITITEHHITIDGRIVRPSTAEHIARADGFQTCAEMRSWFRERYDGLPFRGCIITFE